MTETDPNAPLRSNVRLLGELLGKTLHVQVGKALFTQIETIRQLSKEACAGDTKAIAALNDILQGLSGEKMHDVAKAFGLFLNLANIAENVHRIRRSRWYEINAPLMPQQGSLEALLAMCKERKISKEAFNEALEKLSIDVVLTAHPTEIMRRTIMQKFDSIAKLLGALDKSPLTQDEVQDIHTSLYREITAIWQTDEIRRHRPTPLDEAKWGFAIIEGSLWRVVPQYLREMDKQLKKYDQAPLNLLASPLKISSWMGGDRDGNPAVTWQVTEEVCLLARWMAADLYARDIHKLSAALSMQSCNKALREKVGQTNEPYRALLRELKNKCLATCQWVENKLKGHVIDEMNILESNTDLLAPLTLCYQSLVDCKGESIAQGELLDVIRRVTCFGIGLTRLDIRQESSKHTALLDEITRIHGLGSYVDWDENQRFHFLSNALSKGENLIREPMSLSAQSQEVWHTFQMSARQSSCSLGAYVISMTKAPSDILAVCLLQKEAKVNPMLRVVPLFETLDDLNFAATCFERVLSCPWYKNHIQGKQEIMIGYSDSGKDAGILAAGWAQYRAQEALVSVAKQYRIDLTLFHGRGGSVGRGGAPAHMAILSQPPGSINAKLRVTEQGEVIRNKYGLPERAYRTVELYVSATLEATLLPSPVPKPTWRNIMDTLAQVSYQAYSEVVKEDKAFVDFFTKVTPLHEIGTLLIASRPARRQNSTGIEGLRAIPWVFSWTQNRLLLPAWLGVGEALIHAQNNPTVIDEMVRDWPFFGSLLSLIEMVLTKADPLIFSYYENRLAGEQMQDVGLMLKQKLAQTTTAVKSVLKIQALLESNPILLRTLLLRSPYLYPLHVLQAELCKRLRSKQNKQSVHENDALLITISGIAAGMQNTG